MTHSKGANSPAAPKSWEIPTTAGWYVLGAQAFDGQSPPRHVITFGGQAWPVQCHDENPTLKNDTIEYDQSRQGQRVFLTKVDLQEIRKAMGKKIVRARGNSRRRFAVLKIGSRAASREMKGDVPLECFIYMKPAEEPASLEEQISRSEASADNEPLFSQSLLTNH